MTDAMQPNETPQSQLSAFIDDELPNAETDLLVRRLVRDQELKQTMARYLLAGEAMRNPVNSTLPQPNLSRDFSARIATVLEQDQFAEKPASHVGRLGAFGQWLKPAAGLAVAASAALVAVLVLRGQPDGEAVNMAAEDLQPVTLTAQRPNPADPNAASAGNSYTVPMGSNAPSTPIPVARLTNYVVAHSEFSSPLGRRNTLTGLLVSEQSGDSRVVADARADTTAETVGPDGAGQ